jgi:hypothetical protein
MRDRLVGWLLLSVALGAAGAVAALSAGWGWLAALLIYLGVSATLVLSGTALSARAGAARAVTSERRRDYRGATEGRPAAGGPKRSRMRPAIWSRVWR